MKDSRVGSRANVGVRFGESGRYEVFAIHSRFGGLHWMVEDCERECHILGEGYAAVIRQGDTRADVMHGLGTEAEIEDAAEAAEAAAQFGGAA